MRTKGVFMSKCVKIPFGIIAGSFAMAVFFSTIGLILAYAVTFNIAAATSKVVSFLENWWQVLLFAADILFAVIAIASLIMYILKKQYVNSLNGRKEDE